eukprot:gene22654-29804_t
MEAKLEAMPSRREFISAIRSRDLVETQMNENEEMASLPGQTFSDRPSKRHSKPSNSHTLRRS